RPSLDRRDPHLHGDRRRGGVRLAARARWAGGALVKTLVVAALSGLVFAIGLGISGMTDPRKVIAFLDVTGGWDPSLAFVMMGAIAVHFAFAQRAKWKPETVFGDAIQLPQKRGFDARHLGGPAIFGLGSGIAGYC